MTVVLRRIALSAGVWVALVATVVTALYAMLRAPGPGFGRFGYSYDLISQLLFPTVLALSLVEVLFWRGHWVEYASPSARAVAARMSLCVGELVAAVGAVCLVWLAGRAGHTGGPTAPVDGDGGQLAFAVGNLTLVWAFACVVASGFGPSVASLVTGAVVVAELAVGGRAGVECRAATALQLCPPAAPVSPGQSVWITASLIVTFTTVLVGGAVSSRRYNA